MGDHALFAFYQHKTQEIRPWRPTDWSRHHPYLPPHMGDHPQTFFIPFSTSLCTIGCIGSFSATPDCTSAADDHHTTQADEFECPGPSSLRLRPRAKLLPPRRLEIMDNNYKKGMGRLGCLKVSWIGQETHFSARNGNSNSVCLRHRFVCSRGQSYHCPSP
jgi:hypothetical protein